MKKIIMTVILLQTLMLAAKEDVIQCANLIFGGVHTSRCFSAEFLSDVQKKTSIPTARRFTSVKLASDELFKYPFVVITGEDDFMFTKQERENLRKYLESGGFMLASAGCSNKKFATAFKREISHIFKDTKLKPLPMDHVLFRTLNKIDKLELSHSSSEKPSLEGMEINGRIVLIFSLHGLNDTAHTQGCCCCGGNEIVNSIDVNVNILVYALLH
ncbi:MAG: hypothetical protein A2017_11540 [Lentisphaerae bacterium GWF2_44_16]|nr:MAG: hypothetical protein A2017_11540 [Lentisphaerae bacterium GWF2_44_16]